MDILAAKRTPLFRRRYEIYDAEVTVSNRYRPRNVDRLATDRGHMPALAFAERQWARTVNSLREQEK